MVLHHPFHAAFLNYYLSRMDCGFHSLSVLAAGAHSHPSVAGIGLVCDDAFVASSEMLHMVGANPVGCVD